MTLCPGKHQNFGLSGRWERDLDVDLRAICDWSATILVSLMQDHEFEELGIPDIGGHAASLGLSWMHLPIPDGGVPDETFEAQWMRCGPEIRGRLAQGERVVLHCKGGLGRTGTIAARLLMEFGIDAREALWAVRRARPGTIENIIQENYLDRLARRQG